MSRFIKFIDLNGRLTITKNRNRKIKTNNNFLTAINSARRSRFIWNHQYTRGSSEIIGLKYLAVDFVTLSKHDEAVHILANGDL